MNHTQQTLEKCATVDDRTGADPVRLTFAAAVVTAGLIARAEPGPLALYVAGLMVTLGVNVPLTDDLVAAEPGNASELAAVREDFEGPFDAADIVRTILHTAAIACLAVAPSRALKTS